MLKEGSSLAPVGVTQHSRAMTVLSGPDFQLVDDDSLGKQTEGIGVEEKLPNQQPQWLFELGDGSCCDGNGLEINPYPHPQHMKVVKHLAYD